jgi:hypothetical protein
MQPHTSQLLVLIRDAYLLCRKSRKSVQAPGFSVPPNHLLRLSVPGRLNPRTSETRTVALPRLFHWPAVGAGPYLVVESGAASSMRK